MIVHHVPRRASHLAEEAGLGELSKVYHTEKRSPLKWLVWIVGPLVLSTPVIILAQNAFRLSVLLQPFSLLLIGIMLLAAILSCGCFLICLLITQMSVYIYAAGFIVQRRKKSQVVHWEEVEWVSQENGMCSVYLSDKKSIAISRNMGQLDTLAQEIELKARLVRRPEGREDLERQYEHLLQLVASRQQDRNEQIQSGQHPLLEEAPEEACEFQQEFHLGVFLSTHRAGLKGFWRLKPVSMGIYYLWLSLAVLAAVYPLLTFLLDPVGKFLTTNPYLLVLVPLLLHLFFLPRFFARFIRLHLYTEGLVYIDGNRLEIVRWEQIEKLI